MECHKTLCVAWRKQWDIFDCAHNSQFTHHNAFRHCLSEKWTLFMVSSDESLRLPIFWSLLLLPSLYALYACNRKCATSALERCKVDILGALDWAVENIGRIRESWTFIVVEYYRLLQTSHCSTHDFHFHMSTVINLSIVHVNFDYRTETHSSQFGIRADEKMLSTT